MLGILLYYSFSHNFIKQVLHLIDEKLRFLIEYMLYKDRGSLFIVFYSLLYPKYLEHNMHPIHICCMNEWNHDIYAFDLWTTQFWTVQVQINAVFFSINTVSAVIVFSLINILFSLAYCIVGIQFIIRRTYKIHFILNNCLCFQ